MIGTVAKMEKAGPASAFLRSFDAKLDLLAGGRLMFDHFWPMFANLVAVTLDPEMATSTELTDPGNPSLALMRQMLPLLEGRTSFTSGDIAGARETWKRGLALCRNSDLRGAYLSGIGAALTNLPNYSSDFQIENNQLITESGQALNLQNYSTVGTYPVSPPWPSMPL